MKHYYKTNRINFCTQKCNLKENTMIGSHICKRCENCVDYSQGEEVNENWIICKKLKEALNEN